jgi:hypothetical protein
MSAWTVETALDLVLPLEGLYAGQLTEEERAAFNFLIAHGLARRTWEGVGGLLGLAKVRVLADLQ